MPRILLHHFHKLRLTWLIFVVVTQQEMHASKLLPIYYYNICKLVLALFVFTQQKLRASKWLLYIKSTFTQTSLRLIFCCFTQQKLHASKFPPVYYGNIGFFVVFTQLKVRASKCLIFIMVRFAQTTLSLFCRISSIKTG